MGCYAEDNSLNLYIGSLPWRINILTYDIGWQEAHQTKIQGRSSFKIQQKENGPWDSRELNVLKEVAESQWEPMCLISSKEL